MWTCETSPVPAAPCWQRLIPRITKAAISQPSARRKTLKADFAKLRALGKEGYTTHGLHQAAQLHGHSNKKPFQRKRRDELN